MVATRAAPWTEVYVQASDVPHALGFEAYLVDKYFGRFWTAIDDAESIHVLEGAFRGGDHSLTPHKGVSYAPIRCLDAGF